MTDTDTWLILAKGARLVALGERLTCAIGAASFAIHSVCGMLASTVGEGSSVCLWLDDGGEQHVVHHGSGSGSVLWAVLPSALSVLRLFAVGYEEPCWNYDWVDPPGRLVRSQPVSGMGCGTLACSPANGHRGPWSLEITQRSG